MPISAAATAVKFYFWPAHFPFWDTDQNIQSVASYTEVQVCFKVALKDLILEKIHSVFWKPDTKWVGSTSDKLVSTSSPRQ